MWAFSVFIGDRVRYTDNGGGWLQNLDNALLLIAAPQEIQGRGYRIEYASQDVEAWYASLQVGVLS